MNKREKKVQEKNLSNFDENQFIYNNRQKVMELFGSESFDFQSFDNCCAICMKISWKEPKVCIQCNQVYCKSCIKKLNYCPKCRQKKAKKFNSWNKDVSKYRQEVIDKVQFSHMCQGERRSIELKDLIKHIQLDCDLNKSHKCKNCKVDALFTLQGLVTHIKNDCPKMTVKCENCLIEISRSKSHDCL